MSCILKFRSLKISLETLERSFHRGEKRQICREASWDIWNSPLCRRVSPGNMCHESRKSQWHHRRTSEFVWSTCDSFPNFDSMVSSSLGNVWCILLCSICFWLLPLQWSSRSKVSWCTHYVPVCYFCPWFCHLFLTMCFCVQGDLEMWRHSIQIEQHECKRLERGAPFSWTQ